MDEVKSFLQILLTLLIIALVGYNIYTGATVQKVGIPGVFEIEFGQQTPPPAVPPSFTGGETPPVNQIHLEAEQYDKESAHVSIVECSEGGRLLGWINNGEWVSFEDVDFGSGGLTTFRARVASAESGGQIEIRLDDPNGERVGVCQVYGTGGWQNWETVSCDLTGSVSGKRTVYLVCKGGDTYLFNINWVEFVP